MRTLGRDHAHPPLSISDSAYHHAVVALNFVKADQVSLVLVVRAALLVDVVEHVVANAVADKDIGNEFHE
jgi:hypothetical protein